MKTRTRILGLDIGGANLKAAMNTGEAMSVPFELWKNPGGLADALGALIQRFPKPQQLAATMTGELCDCFMTKREGVESIVKAVSEVAHDLRPIFWSTSAGFYDASLACERYLEVAAANWHALASHVGKQIAPSGSCLLMDMGTTTTDLIPIRDGRPASIGLTDITRMQHGELVYCGSRRTPATTFLGLDAAAELFATVLDAHLILEMMPEQPHETDTADGRPATREFAHARLSRMIGGDPELISHEQTHELAATIWQRQRTHLTEKIFDLLNRDPDAKPRVILSGSGEPLLRRICDDPQITSRIGSIVSLNDHLGETLSHCAPAYAVAVLAEDRVS